MVFLSGCASLERSGEILDSQSCYQSYFAG